MPPKTKFDREAIVEAAFAIAKKKGLSGITARSVANRLGSSVAPIYGHFSSIDQLVSAVVERIFVLSGELLAQQKGPSLFENIGRASLAFARDYPVLVRELVLQPNPYTASVEGNQDALAEALGEDERMSGLTFDDRRRLLLKMRIFQVGLSVMVANGHLPPTMDEESVERLLLETGDDLLEIETMKGKGKIR